TVRPLHRLVLRSGRSPARAPPGWPAHTDVRPPVPDRQGEQSPPLPARLGLRSSPDSSPPRGRGACDVRPAPRNAPVARPELQNPTRPLSRALHRSGSRPPQTNRSLPGEALVPSRPPRLLARSRLHESVPAACESNTSTG